MSKPTTIKIQEQLFHEERDPTLQDTPVQHKAKQTAAVSASLPTSWALTPASPGPLSCQEPSLLSTYARMGSSISGKGGASIQARKSNLTFLSGLFGSLSPGSLLHPGRSRRSGTSASYTVGERERGGEVKGWVGGRAGAWETLHKGLSNDLAPVMQAASREDRVGVWCWLVCLIHHRARGRGETFSRFQEEHENLTPASRSLSPVQKYIPTETDS